MLYILCKWRKDIKTKQSKKKTIILYKYLKIYTYSKKQYMSLVRGGVILNEYTIPDDCYSTTEIVACDIVLFSVL